MKSTAAMIWREYLEHRGAFVYSPILLLGLFLLIMIGLITTGSKVPFGVDDRSMLTVYEMAFAVTSVGWFGYLMVALFFYFADAFSADRKNNSMLFWKSLPLSDFRVLFSKMLAGVTLFPALIVGMMVVTGILIYLLLGLATAVAPQMQAPGIIEAASFFTRFIGFAILCTILAMLWYAPFFAWVGTLSTLVGRWSIPLAFLIPVIASVIENLFVLGVSGLVGDIVTPGLNGPRGGYILNFLRERFHFGIEEDWAKEVFARTGQIDPGVLLNQLLASIDWPQMALGLIVAALLVYAASEYRRRVVAT